MFLKALQKANNIVIVSHRGPDGDTVGSSLALAHYLEQLGKTYTCFCVDTVPDYLAFLPKSEKLGPHLEVWDNPDVDLIIVVDTSDPRHAGIVDYITAPDFITPIITIDHHITNTLYGDYNIVKPQASSACEIIYELLQPTGKITRDIATCLLTGIITDTGSFSNLATTSSAVKIAGDLLAYGANLQLISQQTLHYRPVNTLKLWGRALERLQADPKTGMIVTYITLEDIEECGATETAASGISNFLNDLDEAANKAILVLSQTEPGIIKASLRTTSPLLDVSEFAKLYGGGGHKKAAGFNLKGTLVRKEHGYDIIPTQSL